METVMALLDPDFHGLSDGPRHWRGAQLLPVAELPVGLLLPPDGDAPTSWSAVIVPAEQRAPGLAAAVRQRQWRCLHAPLACRSLGDWAAVLLERGRAALMVQPMATALRGLLEGWRWQPLADGACDPQWLLIQPQLWQAVDHPQRLADAWRQALRPNHASEE